MQRIRWYGPTLVLLVTALLVMIAGPGLAKQMAYTHRQANVQLIKNDLSKNPTLSDLNNAFKDVAKAVEPSVVHIQVYVKERTSRRQNISQWQEEMMRRFFGQRMPQELMPPDEDENDGEQDLPTDPRQRRQSPSPPSSPDMDRYNVPQPTGNGSGWVYSKDGYIITNHHVVDHADRIVVRFQDGTERTATVKGSDPKTDVAVIKVDGSDLHPATLASEPVEQGEIVFAFGSPFQFAFSMSQGIVSAKGRKLGILNSRDAQGNRVSGYENFIQTDAAINPGNSGGPLTNIKGEVVGMNAAIATRTGAYNGLGFAIPVDMVQRVADQLIHQGKVTRGYLGIFIRDLDPKMAKTFGFTQAAGVLVDNPIEGSPAQAAGIQRGDIITKLDGRIFATADELRNFVSTLSANKKIEIEIFRQGKVITIPVTIGTLPDEPGQASKTGEAHSNKPDKGMQLLRKLGFENVTAMTKEQAARQNIPFTPGVLVLAVRQGSVAQSEGMARGVIIVDVMGSKVATPAELAAELTKHDLAKGVRLSIRVGDAEHFVLLELPAE